MGIEFDAYYSQKSVICHAVGAIKMQCLGPNLYPTPNFYLDSDSDPAKIFRFSWIRMRIRIRNTGRSYPCSKLDE
jgi:hypothetical protein